MKYISRICTLATALAACVAPVVHAQSLTTTFRGGNGNSVGGAVYFDLNVAAGITVTSLDVNVSAPDAPTNAIVNVYTRTGTATGFETATPGWTLVASGTGTTSPENTPTAIDVSDFVLSSGVTGIAIVNVNHSAIYTNGDGVTNSIGNDDLSFIVGSATNVAFSGPVFQPRVWNGTIRYTPGVVVPESGTVALLLPALGVLGAVMVRRRKK